MNMDLKILHRNGYTVLDMLSDVGGVESIFVTAFAFFISIWNHDNFDNYLVSHLFTYSADPEEKG